MTKKILTLAAVVVILVAGGYYLLTGSKNGIQYRTERVTRGEIRSSVTATGTVSAVTTVQVGTQVSGTIKEIYVDFNSPVRKGQLLAQIDPALPQAKVAQARANLMAAEANVEKAAAALKDAQRNLERSRGLFEKNFIARADLDAAETGEQSARAQLAAAKAQVEQSRAALQQEETNLLYTRILSPVNGIVISRNVDIGQTVAASFQTPTLFSIAQDLTQMQIDTNVDEADIGRVKVGQPVEFTVDAYPDMPFTGRVAEIRNAPITVQNVVTYDVVVKVANPKLLLKPGMTANVSIVTAVERDVLRVPNAALRFKGPAGEKAQVRSGPRSPEAGRRSVWVLRGKTPQRLAVTTGISDGTHTAVSGEGLKEGDLVVIEAASAKNGAAPRVGPPGFFR